MRKRCQQLGRFTFDKDSANDAVQLPERWSRFNRRLEGAAFNFRDTYSRPARLKIISLRSVLGALQPEAAHCIGLWALLLS